ncbi:hypothetical protein J7J84_05870 [bacterium]|nr:hypothetical protein [bacterium]
MMRGYFWRIWAVVLVLSTVWLGACIKASSPARAQADVPNKVVASRFVVVDDEGNERAALGMGADDSLSLWLSGPNGKKRAGVVVLADGSPSLSLLDSSGDVRVDTAVLPDGSAFLALADSNREIRAGLYLEADGSPALKFLDGDGEELFSAP